MSDPGCILGPMDNDRAQLLRDARDKRIMQAMGLPWLYTGRITVNGDGVSWSDWHRTWNQTRPLPEHTTEVWVGGVRYLTRTFHDMSPTVVGLVENAHREYTDAMNGYPRSTASAFERLRVEFNAVVSVVADGYVYPWAVPLVYRLEAFLDRFRR